MAHYNEMISLLRAHENASTQAIKDGLTAALKLAFDAIVNDQASIDVRIIAEYNSAEGRQNIPSIKLARSLMGIGLKDAKDYAEKLTGHAEYRRSQQAERDALYMTGETYSHIVHVDNRHPHIRQGQEIMNRCAGAHSLMYDHLQSKGLDCFYDDSQIDAVVCELWSYVSG